MEKRYLLSVAINLELYDEAVPLDQWEEERDREEVDTAALERLKENPALRDVLLQLRALHQAEAVIRRLREPLEIRLSRFGLNDENKVDMALGAIATNGYVADCLMDTMEDGFLEEVKDED